MASMRLLCIFVIAANFDSSAIAAEPVTPDLSAPATTGTEGSEADISIFGEENVSHLYTSEVADAAMTLKRTCVFINSENSLIIEYPLVGNQGETFTIEIPRGTPMDDDVKLRIEKMQKLDLFWRKQLEFLRTHSAEWVNDPSKFQKLIPSDVKTEKQFDDFVIGIERALDKNSKQREVIGQFYGVSQP